MAAKRRTETYTTSEWDPDGKGPPVDPVVAVQVKPSGEVYRLGDVRDCYGPKKLITIGSSSAADIRLRDPKVSRQHCRLCRTPQGRVLIEPAPNSHNRTKVNRARLYSGQMELGPGDVIRVGKTQLVALSASGVQSTKITADDPADYVERMVGIEGTQEKAAEIFDVHPSTVSRWRRRGRHRP